MFTAPEGGPARPAAYSHAWRLAKAATGAPQRLRPHDLRHHAATLAARSPGITTKELMARIGHGSPRAALRYQHATRERDEQIAAHLDAVIASTGASNIGVVVPIQTEVRGVGAGLGG